MYVFDVVPKSHQLNGAVDRGGVVAAAAPKAPEEVGLSDQQKVQLLLANSVVIDIICNADSNNTVLVVSYLCREGIFVLLISKKKENLINVSFSN